MGDRVDVETFEGFFALAEPRLRRALAAAHGPVAGREASVDALSWAWEHWSEVRSMRNPLGYLYRVGSTAARRQVPAQRRAAAQRPAAGESPFEPALGPALARLTEQQRTALVLVHGFGYTFRDAAEVLGVSLSTLRNHVERALAHVRIALEVEDAVTD